MICIVGNSLNSTNKKILEKMNKMDFQFIEREISAQVEEGAEYIELNANSLLDNEIYFLREAIPLIEQMGGKAVVRSNSIETLTEIIKIAKEEIIIGDINYDKDKINKVLDCVKNEKVKIIAIVKDNENENAKMTPEKSLLIAQKYIDYLLDCGVRRKDILLEPIVKPLELDYSNGRNFLNTLELFKLDFPQIKTIANLSILSEGLPKRQIISAHCVALAIEKGLDFAVLNVLEKTIVESVISTLTIIGKDRHMKSYLNFCKNKKESRNQIHERSEDKRDFN